jgi:hypothetical protein
MSQNSDNFIKWFKGPITTLQNDPDAGFAILMISLPLLERYLRQQSGNFENPGLDDAFCNCFKQLFPSVKDIPTARKFWETFRHGLLHQAAIKSADGVIQAGVHNAAQEIQVGYNNYGWTFTVSPNGFSKKVIDTIEADFPTFEAAGSPRHTPASVSPFGSGISGVDYRPQKP